MEGGQTSCLPVRRSCLDPFGSQTDRNSHYVASGDLRNVIKTITRSPEATASLLTLR